MNVPYGYSKHPNGDVPVCLKCGAIVGDTWAHDQWHSYQDSLAGRLELVEEKK